MATTTEKIDQDATPPCFNLGDLVWARTRFHSTTFWLGVICPHFGPNDQYTFVAETRRRYYHVQRLGQSFEQAWLPEDQLTIMEHDNVTDMARSIDDCKMFMEKVNEERVEICSIRAKAIQINPANIGNHGELLEAKVQNEILKNELWRLKESIKDKETLKNDLKKLNESHNDIKESIEDLKNIVIFQNQSRPQSANVGTDQKSNIETQFCFQQPLKNIMFEDQSEAIQRLNQFIKNLKEDNLKLSEKNPLKKT